MATKITKLSGSTKNMTDKEKMYSHEYVANGFNKTAAAKYAGYANPKVACHAVHNRPRVNRYIAKILRRRFKRQGIQQHEVIQQLWYGLTRKLSDFVDEDSGKLITDIDSLNERAQACVDGIEQTVTVHKDGTEEIKTKLKITPKSSYVDMAMKHKGLFTPEMVEQVIKIDYDKLQNAPPKTEDPFDKELSLLESMVEEEISSSPQKKGVKNE